MAGARALTRRASTPLTFRVGDRVVRRATRDAPVAASVATSIRSLSIGLLPMLFVNLVVLVGLALMLMTFPAARQIGASLLASAGVVGIVAGFAARPVLGKLIAGLQIGLSQPIRLGDVVIVENEWA